MFKIKVFILTTLTSLFSPVFMKLQAQISLAEDSIKHKYSFIKTDKNIIQCDSSSLFPFFEKLDQLKSGSINKVSVIHLGDSHLQADFFPGLVRRNLQKNFGNAGRGLITPYKVGRTNEPPNYKTSSNIKWRARRIVIEKDSLPIGISGLTIKSDSSNSKLNINVFNQDELDYGFNTLTLYHQKGYNCFNLDIADSLGQVMTSINSQIDTMSSLSAVHFNATNSISIQPQKTDSGLLKSTTIYGILLENGMPGILYHTIGINGAKYQNYNLNPMFQQQMATLHPDLIIISMGTNEAYAHLYNNAEFYAQVDSLISILRIQNPDASLLITTPGDSFKKRKYKNPNNLRAANTLINYCQKNNLCYWNWFDVMGGKGSINKWFLRGLSSKDKLHLSPKGYEVQGALLYSALIKAYHQYMQYKENVK